MVIESQHTADSTLFQLILRKKYPAEAQEISNASPGIPIKMMVCYTGLHVEGLGVDMALF